MENKTPDKKQEDTSPKTCWEGFVIAGTLKIENRDNMGNWLGESEIGKITKCVRKSMKQSGEYYNSAGETFYSKNQTATDDDRINSRAKVRLDKCERCLFEISDFSEYLGRRFPARIIVNADSPYSRAEIIEMIRSREAIMKLDGYIFPAKKKDILLMAADRKMPRIEKREIKTDIELPF